MAAIEYMYVHSISARYTLIFRLSPVATHQGVSVCNMMHPPRKPLPSSGRRGRPHVVKGRPRRPTYSLCKLVCALVAELFEKGALRRPLHFPFQRLGGVTPSRKCLQLPDVSSSRGEKKAASSREVSPFLLSAENSALRKVAEARFASQNRAPQIDR